MLFGLFLSALLLGACSLGSAEQPRLLHASFDTTREMFAEINAAFTHQWRQRTGQAIALLQSHGGSGKQARSVIDGLPADVVSLALAYDIEKIAEQTNLIPTDWPAHFPWQSTPFASTVVFLVRKGNPKSIRDWPDLTRSDIRVITPNPKTSGGARWNYLAAWGYALRHSSGDEVAARAFVAALYRNVPVLDTGARAATVTFAQRGVGDVLVAWETEAHLTIERLGFDRLEIVVPSETILAELPVAIVEENAHRHGVFEVATQYVRFLYSTEAQTIAARHGFRPRDPAVMGRLHHQFAHPATFTLAEIAGSWRDAHAKHFADGGIFDQIYEKSNRSPSYPTH